MPGHDFFIKLDLQKHSYGFSVFSTLIVPSVQQEIFLKTILFNIFSDLWKWMFLDYLATFICKFKENNVKVEFRETPNYLA